MIHLFPFSITTTVFIGFVSSNILCMILILLCNFILSSCFKEYIKYLILSRVVLRTYKIFFLEQFGSLSMNGCHGLKCLSTWFPVGETVWEGLGGMALLEEVCQ